MLKIEPAKIEDVSLILKFIQELAVFEEFPFDVTVTKDDLEKNLFGQNSIAETIICYSNETPCGFAVFYNTFSTTTGKPGLHLDDLFILPQYQGQGIGSKVLHYLSNLAKDRGCARFEWWALKTNIAATQFYQGIGAKTVDEINVFRLNSKEIDSVAKGK